MIDNSKKFIELREKYKKIIFDKYDIADNEDDIRLTFHYVIVGLSDFESKWIINKANREVKYSVDKLRELVFSLGMVELISYYKITCPKNVEVSCHALSNEQIIWWKKLFVNGLSEFSYTNNINIDESSISFLSTSDKGYEPISIEECIYADKVLIPIGGGKDSAVTIEVLNHHFDRYGFIINERAATIDTFKASGIDEKKIILAKRTFDEKIVRYNSEGFLNGHTPFSAIVAFSSVIAAYVNGIKYVALSNESSANETTVKGVNVNHQYSKTYEFECDFRDYEKKYIDTGVYYFSLLRPLTEVGIAKIFSTLDKYHDIFRSCNAGSKNNVWCATCAKCLFVFIILSSFIDRQKIIKIFGKNMLDDMSLKDIFDKLIGKTPEKPFECVGRRDEVNASLRYLCDNEYKNDLPRLLKYYKELDIKIEDDLPTLCKSYDVNNNLPTICEKALKEYIV